MPEAGWLCHSCRNFTLPSCPKQPGVWHQILKGTHPGDGVDFSPGAADATLLNLQAARIDQVSEKAFGPSPA